MASRETGNGIAAVSTRWRPGSSTPALAIFTGLSAVAAVLTPLWAAEPDRVAGLLLVGGVVAEFVHSFRRRTGPRSARMGERGFTLLLALVLLNTSWLAAAALAVFVAVPFALDALRRFAAAAARWPLAAAVSGRDALAAFGNVAAVGAVLLIGRYALNWVVGGGAGDPARHGHGQHR